MVNMPTKIGPKDVHRILMVMSTNVVMSSRRGIDKSLFFGSLIAADEVRSWGAGRGRWTDARFVGGEPSASIPLRVSDAAEAVEGAPIPGRQ
jgi:hypothetical protein